MSSHEKIPTRFLSTEEALATRTLHEATLQDLIRAKNYAILHILHERNELLRERNSLRGDDTEFPHYDYISPPEDSTLPYTALWIDGKCHVLQFRVSRPSWARYPVDRRQFDVSTQTEDADTTLAEINPLDIDSKPSDEHMARKRKASK
ncbi:hypothetical protein BJY52DRAFT_1231499 [Lactarius psammicola]|nr:hypothetical protein BJY52DRAFT_1231499 [Lactarius psammicola]